MLAYNKDWLENKLVTDQADHAFRCNLISEQEYSNIQKNYIAGFFTPNFFVRTGLFLLTVIISIFSSGLVSLFLVQTLGNSVAALTIAFGAMAYAVLELLIRSKNYYKAGVDDALIWMSAGLICSGITFGVETSSVTVCCITFVLAIYYTLRFANGGMAIIAFLACAGTLFFLCTALGGMVKAIVPFVIMLHAAVVYFASKKIVLFHKARHYVLCLQLIEITALLTFYIGGNYLVVRELSNSMFNLNLQEGQSIPFANLFWAFTYLTPVVYVAFGLIKKDRILLRTGLVIVAATVLTCRNYYHVIELEAAMSAVGIFMIILSVLVIRYLATPKHRFSYHPPKISDENGGPELESLVIAEHFSGAANPVSGTGFGGGSFGGGGGGGEF